MPETRRQFAELLKQIAASEALPAAASSPASSSSSSSSSSAASSADAAEPDEEDPEEEVEDEEESDPSGYTTGRGDPLSSAALESFLLATAQYTVRTHYNWRYVIDMFGYPPICTALPETPPWPFKLDQQQRQKWLAQHVKCNSLLPQLQAFGPPASLGCDSYERGNALLARPNSQASRAASASACSDK